MNYNKGEKLITDLLLNPRLFEKQQKGYSLLKEFFRGMPIEALIPLLKSNDGIILKTGISIVSEMGDKVCSLMPYIATLINSEDAFIRYCTLECILLCGKGEYVNEFIHLINSINIKDGNSKHLEMLLLYNAEMAQLEEGYKLVSENKIADHKLHEYGLNKLMNRNNSEEEIIEMLDSVEPLTQRYGAIISARIYERSPELIKHALQSTDHDVKEFAKLIIDLYQDD